MKKAILSLILAFSLCAGMDSCVGSKVVFVPSYDATVVTQLENVVQKTETMYLTMKDAPNKSYNNYLTQYTDILGTLYSLKSKEELRPKSKAIVTIADNALTHFEKYMNEHKAKGNISAGEIQVYLDYMRSWFHPWLVAEKSLNKS